MGTKYEIEIPTRYTEPLLCIAAEAEKPVEEIAEAALKNYLKRMRDTG